MTENNSEDNSAPAADKAEEARENLHEAEQEAAAAEVERTESVHEAAEEAVEEVSDTVAEAADAVAEEAESTSETAEEVVNEVVEEVQEAAGDVADSAGLSELRAEIEEAAVNKAIARLYEENPSLSGGPAQEVAEAVGDAAAETQASPEVDLPGGDLPEEVAEPVVAPRDPIAPMAEHFWYRPRRIFRRR